MLGGVWQVWAMVVGSIVGYVSQKLYVASMLKQLYLRKKIPNITWAKRKLEAKASKYTLFFGIFIDHVRLCFDCCGGKRLISRWTSDKRLATYLWNKIEREREIFITTQINQDQPLTRTERDHMLNSLCNRSLFKY